MPSLRIEFPGSLGYPLAGRLEMADLCRLNRALHSGTQVATRAA